MRYALTLRSSVNGYEPSSLSMPRSWVERVCDVRRWTEFPRGGHFAALEAPELLAEDIRAFFRTLR